VSGIITLASPFVSARPRRFRPYVSAITFLLVATPVVAGALLLAHDSRRAGLVSPACALLLA